MSTCINFDAVWGGYYATHSRTSGEFSLFRLLDFNQHAYHAAIFTEKFPSLPPDSVVLGLKPYIGHAPIDARALVREGDLILVGRAPLTSDDLEGYCFDNSSSDGRRRSKTAPRQATPAKRGGDDVTAPARCAGLSITGRASELPACDP